MLAALAAVAVVLAGVAYAAYVWAPAIGRVSPTTLSHSVTREVGGSSILVVQPCRRTGERLRTCFVSDAEGSGGGASYRVRLDGRRCWTARRGRPFGSEAPHWPRRLHGCARLGDQVRLLDRL